MDNKQNLNPCPRCDTENPTVREVEETWLQVLCLNCGTNVKEPKRFGNYAIEEWNKGFKSPNLRPFLSMEKMGACCCDSGVDSEWISFYCNRYCTTKKANSHDFTKCWKHFWKWRKKQGYADFTNVEDDTLALAIWENSKKYQKEKENEG